jgi:hypothetical protein
MLNFLIMVMWYLFSKSKIYFCKFRLEQKNINDYIIIEGGAHDV